MCRRVLSVDREVGNVALVVRNDCKRADKLSTGEPCILIEVDCLRGAERGVARVVAAEEPRDSRSPDVPLSDEIRIA